MFSLLVPEAFLKKGCREGGRRTAQGHSLRGFAWGGLGKQSLVGADRDSGAESDGEGETAETTSSGSTWMGSYSLQA